jgi:hypothetical protein
MNKFILLVLMLFTSAQIYAQAKPIKGTISDAEGAPLVGAIISVKSNPGNQVLSNANGVYQINVLDFDKGVLVFSFVGFTTQEITVNNRSEINVQLKPSQENLADVVVVAALGVTRKQRSVTYASQAVDPTTLTEARDLNDR